MENNINEQVVFLKCPKILLFVKLTGLLTIGLALFKIIFDSYALIISVEYALKGILDAPKLGFAVTVIVYAVCFMYAVFGWRILHPKDKNTTMHIWILFVLSLGIGFYEAHRLNLFGYYLYILAAFLLVSNLILYWLRRSQIFKDGLITKKYLFNKVGWAVFVIVTIGLFVAVPILEKKIYPQIVWKTYQDAGWGFEISYPMQYRFVSDEENLNGPRHYLIPQEPYATSGYVGKLLEVVNVQGTSTILGYLQVTLLPVRPASLETVDEQVKAIAASSTLDVKKMGGSVEFAHITIDGINMPVLVYPSPGTIPGRTSQATYVYYYVPPTTLFGVVQSSKLFRIEFGPNNSSIFQQMAKTMKIIPLAPTDEDLYMTAADSKDSSFCDHVISDDIRTQCYIAVRGYPIIEKYPLPLDLIVGKNGTVKVVGTSSVVLTATKNNNATSGVAWISFVVTPTTPWQAITFDAVFSNGVKSEGLLNAFWDAQNIGSEDGRLDMSFIGSGPFEIGTTTSAYTAHVFGLRLDTFGSSTGSVTISNIKGETIH